ncbi:hypothetical protein Bca4012_021554 [Brassica carinata]
MSPPTFLGPHVHPNWDPLSLLYSSLINAAFNYTAFPLFSFTLSLCFPLCFFISTNFTFSLKPTKTLKKKKKLLFNSTFSSAKKSLP